MSLLDESMTTCTLMDRTTVSDGYGGYTNVWKDGAEISVAIVLNNSIEARVADAQGVTDLYTVTTRKNINLQYGQVFRRESDGKYFRVTSNGDDMKTPTSASLNMRQVSAEKLDALPR